jgi:hypothetical protein
MSAELIREDVAMRDDTEENPVASRHSDELVYCESSPRIRGTCGGDDDGSDEGRGWLYAVEGS